MDPTIFINNLQDHPRLIEVSAKRIWHEWSKSRGKSLDEVRNKILGILDSRSEFILIALNSNGFVGTVSLLDTDLVSRPCMTPWIAAVYVEPEFRGNGYATQLIDVAESMAWGQGRDRVYLHCRSELRMFYSGLGYREIEANVGELNSYIFLKIRN